ncbi:MAG TPA: hypothetical protein VFY27_12950 [Woeseiaceae bacterium]|nr:hypothetical protein [Woeseiaceae bacterium]
MNIRMMLAAVVIGLSFQALANFAVVSEAYEVPLADIRLPANANGTLAFKACETCDYATIRVTTTTQYEANNSVLDLEAFRKELERIRNPREVTATVLHHLESNTIQAIRIKF